MGVITIDNKVAASQFKRTTLLVFPFKLAEILVDPGVTPVAFPFVSSATLLIEILVGLEVFQVTEEVISNTCYCKFPLRQTLVGNHLLLHSMEQSE